MGKYRGEEVVGTPWDQSGAVLQISRFLVVDPQRRYTAREALAHPFFQQYDVEEVRHFSPFRKFKVRLVLGTGTPWHPEPRRRTGDGCSGWVGRNGVQQC